MADPVVHITNGVPDSGTGNITTLGAVVAKQPALGTAGSASTDVITVQGIASGTAMAVSLASVPSHAVTNAGTFAVQEADCANTTIGSKADAKSTATDTTAVTLMQVSKQISASAQTIATNSGAALAAGTAVIGKVGIDQTSDGTTKVIGTVNVAASQTIGVTNTPLTNFGAGEYETVAASATDQILGATGGVGDYLSGLLITPTTTAAGSVSIKDGNGSAIPIFNTGTLSNLVPFFVPLGMITVNGTTPGWKVTTGANVTVIGVGNFT